ncbi:Uncharacterized protein AB751O23_AG_00120 [Chlamydiales bacterium SCGC AB-751-O23]|jgi:CDP-diacylglycerol---glycerol-3-phosphate 3-phosphatidyltransferase|nr:Uncharacterized protein AB751O23_AG_00120 [Chlamydiales bacterium SCGC AB-751-O23]
MKSFLISNFLSVLRCPLAFLFLKKNICVRLFALTFALITDFLDGFIARKFSATSKLGAILDPLMDRFFVLFVGSILFFEKQLDISDLLFLVSRDVFLVVVGLYFCLTKGFKHIIIESTYFGKITTVSQFLVLFALTYDDSFLPSFTYPIFLGLGLLTALEVLIKDNKE